MREAMCKECDIIDRLFPGGQLSGSEVSMTRAWPTRSASVWVTLCVAILLLLALLLAAMPTLAQSAPTLSVTPPSGIVNQPITLFGSGYSAGPATIQWDGVDTAQVDIPAMP